jgi:hypothetical protein
MASKVRSAQTHGNNSRVYVPILVDIFQRKYQDGDEIVQFTLDEVRETAERLDMKIRNPSDLVYRMKSRTKLPSEILDKGFTIIKIVKKGVYQFQLGESTIVDLTKENVIQIQDTTPVAVRRFLEEKLSEIDEQGLLTIVHYCDLLSHFTGLKIYRLKSHVRKSVVNIGQVEVDEVDIGVGLDSLETPIIFPIEAKSASDPLNWTQIANQVNFSKQLFLNYVIRPIGIKVDYDSLLHIIEFTPEMEANKIKIKNSATYNLILSEEQINAIRSNAQNLR